MGKYQNYSLCLTCC